MIRKVLCKVSLALLIATSALPSGAETLRRQDVRVESTRTHKCQSRLLCGRAKSVDVSRVRIRDGSGQTKSGTIRTYRDKNGRPTRIEIQPR